VEQEIPHRVSMSIRIKLIVLLGSVLSLLGLLSVIFFLQFIRPSFLAIEQKEAINDVQRVIYAIQNETEHLNSLNHDWAAWDATYDFMRTLSDEYVEENLPISSFTDNSLNLIHFYDVSGKLVWGETRDLATEELTTVQEFSFDSLPADHPLLRFDFDSTLLSEVAIKGFWMTEHGPMLLSSRPILNNENEGPVRGTLMMGRFLDETVIEKLIEQTRVSFSVAAMTSDTLPEFLAGTGGALGSLEQIHIDWSSGERLRMSTTYPDLKGDPSLLFQAEKNRDIYKNSRTVIQYSLTTFLLSILTVFVLLSFFLQKIVVGPIKALTEHALKIGGTGDLSARIEPRGKDEVGLLAREFNTMTARLHEAKHRLQEQSFQQGMAELASGILHNVRNSLHKLFSNMEKIRTSIDRIPVEKISRARKELLASPAVEERRDQLAGFLDASNESLLAFIDRTKEQLEKNTPLVTEIERTLKSYEKWAFGHKFAERVQVEPLVREAYQFLERTARESVSLEVAPGVGEVGYITSNRVVLIQIFINLFTNAVESIRNVDGLEGKITVAAETVDMDYGESVHVRVADNGDGIDKSVLAHIFTRGFSTKTGKNTGLGLQWCCNAVEAMNGRLYAESEGKGRGACFHLILPKNV